MNITDSWRRIAEKARLTTCLSDFNSFFQKGHSRVFQFSTATPDGAATMFHIVNALPQLVLFQKIFYSTDVGHQKRIQYSQSSTHL
jgi:hypothetical protein